MPSPPVEADTFEQCVHAKAQAVARALRDDRWRTLIATLGVAAEANDDAAAYGRWVALSRGGVADYVRQCRIADSLDPAWVSDLVLGPIYLDAVMLHEPLTPAQVEAHVAATLGLLAQRPDDAAGREAPVPLSP